jgi:hypothetical protein
VSGVSIICHAQFGPDRSKGACSLNLVLVLVVVLDLAEVPDYDVRAGAATALIARQRTHTNSNAKGKREPRDNQIFGDGLSHVELRGGEVDLRNVVLDKVTRLQLQLDRNGLRRPVLQKPQRHAERIEAPFVCPWEPESPFDPWYHRQCSSAKREDKGLLAEMDPAFSPKWQAGTWSK